MTRASRGDSESELSVFVTGLPGRGLWTRELPSTFRRHQKQVLAHPRCAGQEATRGKVGLWRELPGSTRQATLPGAGPAPAPHSKAVHTETTECPPAPPVRPFSQELKMTWTTPEKGVSPRIIRAMPQSRSLYPGSLAAPGTAAPSSRAALLTLLVKD